MALVGSSADVGSVGVDAHEAPHLLRLPKELRLQILEYVLCNKVLHMGTRPLTLDEQGGYMYEPVPYQFKQLYKPMYTVCPQSSMWDKLYQESKSPSIPASSEISSHVFDHRSCRAVLHDFQENEFLPRSIIRCDCAIKPCIHFFEHRRRMISQYGEPPAGIRALHADTKLDLSSLRVCRLLYGDARRLPYSGNTFCFRDRPDLNIFLDHALARWQRDSIQTLCVMVGSFSKPTLPTAIPRNLQALQCYMARPEDYAHLVSNLHSWLHKFSCVQVIINDRGSGNGHQQVVSHRHLAERIEQLLSV